MRVFPPRNMLMRWNKPKPLAIHTSAPIKATVRSAPKTVPRSQERKVRELAGFAGVGGSLACGAWSMVMRLSGNLQCRPSQEAHDHGQTDCFEAGRCGRILRLPS